MVPLQPDKKAGNGQDLTNQESSGPLNERDLLYLLIDNIPDFIYIKDLESRFVLANQHVADSHNLESGSIMIGKTDHDFYPRALADKYLKDEQKILKTGVPLIGHEEKTLDEKGGDIFLSTTKIPIKNKGGKIVGLVGIGRDITERKNVELKALEDAEDLQHINTLLEEKQEEIQQQSEELSAQTEHLQTVNHELEKLTIAVSETDNVVLILDAEGRFEWVNRSFTRVYGKTMEEFIEEHGNNILEGSYNPHIKDIISKCKKTGKTVRYQSEAKDKDGNTIWVQSTLTPIFDDAETIIRYVAIDTDVTALKKAQEMINRQKNELEEHGRQLEKANITKDKFFSIIAHDLKNPFHSIMGFSDLLSNNYDRITDEKKREYLGLIHDSSRFANNLLDNLLNWSRTQTEKIKFNPSRIELHSIAQDTYRMLQGSMDKKKIHFDNNIPENTYAWADPNMIQTVLRNLISNAIKFTPENGTIELRTEAVDKKIRLSVRDTGIGIPEEKQSKLFDSGEFYTTSGTDGEHGTGLGLLICREFLRKHGGKIKLDSVPGIGTTFYFEIPAEE